MDLEQLTTSQVVLLTLFVSFITGMATSVATVSLMQNEPTSVGQTVSRVIQSTIHEVTSPATTTVFVPVQPVVDPSSLLTAALQKVSPSVIYIFNSDGVTQLGTGIVIDTSGTILTDSAIIGNATEASTNIGTQHIRLNLLRQDPTTGIAYLVATSSGTTTIAWSPVTIARAVHLLGEPVFSVLLGKSQRLVRGVITSETPANATTPSTIDTDLPGISSDTMNSGIGVFSASGALIGIRTHVSAALAQSTFILFNTQKPGSTLKVLTPSKGM